MKLYKYTSWFLILIFLTMNLYISSDHGGFEIKKTLLDFLNNSSDIPKFEIEDLGPFTLDPNDDYPTYGIKLAEKVSNNRGSLGILICRSGNGMVIAANKVKGAYAALCFTPKHAEMARKDDNSNILCLDADYEGEEALIEITKSFLNSQFAGTGTRHERRFNEIKEYEEQHCN